MQEATRQLHKQFTERSVRAASIVERSVMNKAHAQRIYFEQIKRSVSITTILDRYGILSEMKRMGSTLKGTCPIHRGSNDRQFTIDENKGLFKCFSPKCGRGGDIITLVSALEGGIGIRDAALLIADW